MMVESFMQLSAPHFWPLAFSLQPFLPESTLNWSRGHRGEQPLFGLREDRCLRVSRRADEFCLAGARLISHLPGEPLEARLNPVQAFVVAVRSSVLVLETLIVLHATTIGWQ